MDVEADVALVGDPRLTRMHAHADAHRRGCELALRSRRRGDGVRRALEGDEERVALGVHLDPAVAVEGAAEHAPMLLEGGRVAVPEFV